MTQKWEKLGLIFCPSGKVDWMHSHAAVPIAEFLGDNLFKIYFSSRDKYNRSFTGFVVIDIEQPNDIIEVSSQPILSPGEIGEFDDSGAQGTWLTTHGENRYLYYTGWNLGVTVPFRNSIGLSISHENKKFARHSSGPIVDRTKEEPHFCANCCVIVAEGIWRMWYLSCTGWSLTRGHPKHKYHIKYATSTDGINWERRGVVAIDFANDNEYAISRPSVIQSNNEWKMWYSFRGDAYRIGYAESQDGYTWNRLDNLCGIETSKSGWDSEMVEYPFVFEHKGQRYMLYNGNGYGKTGFGLATQEIY